MRSRFALLLAATLLGAPAARAACPARVEGLQAHVREGIAAFERMDASAFEQASYEARDELSCLQERLPREAAADFHLLMALDGYMAQDDDRTVGALRAVIQLRPGWKLPAALAPQKNLLRDLYGQAARAGPSPALELLEGKGRFLVDGVEASTRPADRPAVMQWVSDAGEVRWTGYLPAGTHLPMSVLAAMTEEDALAVYRDPTPAPADPAAPAPAPAPVAGPGPSAAPLPAEPPRERRLSPWWLGASGAAVASGGLFAAALVTRASWRAEVDACVVDGACQADPDGALDRLDAQAGRARVLGYGAQATAGVALGLGVTAVITGTW